MIRSINEKTAPLGQSAKKLTDGYGIASASAALAILQLPLPLRRFSNACDMLDMLAREPWGRFGYILSQAHTALDAYSWFQPGGHKIFAWRETDEYHDEMEKLIAEALKKRREWIEQETNVPRRR